MTIQHSLIQNTTEIDEAIQKCNISTEDENLNHSQIPSFDSNTILRKSDLMSDNIINDIHSLVASVLNDRRKSIWIERARRRFISPERTKARDYFYPYFGNERSTAYIEKGNPYFISASKMLSLPSTLLNATTLIYEKDSSCFDIKTFPNLSLESVVYEDQGVQRKSSGFFRKLGTTDLDEISEHIPQSILLLNSLNSNSKYEIYTMFAYDADIYGIIKQYGVGTILDKFMKIMNKYDQAKIITTTREMTNIEYLLSILNFTLWFGRSSSESLSTESTNIDFGIILLSVDENCPQILHLLSTLSGTITEFFTESKVWEFFEFCTDRLYRKSTVISLADASIYVSQFSNAITRVQHILEQQLRSLNDLDRTIARITSQKILTNIKATIDTIEYEEAQSMLKRKIRDWNSISHLI